MIKKPGIDKIIDSSFLNISVFHHRFQERINDCGRYDYRIITEEVLLMKKIFALVATLMVLCATCCVLAEEGGTKITGNIEDGCYVLTVSVDPEDTGEWRADEMAQDQSVVKLAASGTENGVFTARYEPTGDGDVSVNLRHFTGEEICDEMHSFDLRVEGGKVTETIGGSYTASPAEEDLDPFFSGEWTEKESQFTTLSAAKNADGGWNVEIASPISHGAWLIRATAYYDCDYDAFVYNNGVKYDLIPGDEVTEKETAKELWGIIMFTGTQEEPELALLGTEAEGQVFFERVPGQPEAE